MLGTLVSIMKLGMPHEAPATSSHHRRTPIHVYGEPTPSLSLEGVYLARHSKVSRKVVAIRLNELVQKGWNPGMVLPYW